MVSTAFMMFLSKRPLTYNKWTHVRLGVILTLCHMSKKIVVIIGVRILRVLETERLAINNRKSLDTFIARAGG